MFYYYLILQVFSANIISLEPLYIPRKMRYILRNVKYNQLILLDLKGRRELLNRLPRHAGFDPVFSVFLDSRLRGNDNWQVFNRRVNISRFLILKYAKKMT